MISKRAQLGKIITFLPVLILIVIIISIYITLAAGITLLNFEVKPTITSPNLPGIHKNLLFETITINGQNLIVYEAAIKTLSGEIPQNTLKETLKSLSLKDENNCIILEIVNENVQGIRIFIKQGEDVLTRDGWPIESFDEKLETNQEIMFNNQPHFVLTYYGPCQNE